MADLRGLAARERAACIIKNCVAPLYHDKITDYFDRAVTRGGQTPYMLEEAFLWHVKMQQHGSML